jgi:hypothetical protein
LWKDAKDEEIEKSHTNSSNQVLIKEETKTKETINEDASNMVVVDAVYSSESSNLKSQSDSKIIPKTKYLENNEDAILSADDVRILDDYKNNELEENYYEEDMIHDNQSDTYLKPFDENDHKMQSLSQYVLFYFS